MAMTNVLVVVPARAGSIGVKNKNIRLLNGLPLFVHSYNYFVSEDLQNSSFIFSTDSADYIKIACNHGLSLDQTLLRPSSIAQSFVVDYPVALHALLSAEERFCKSFEYLVWLRPTSPFRPPGLISRCLEILSSNPEASSVRAVRRSSEHPYRVWLRSEPAGPISPLLGHLPKSEPYNIPRQLLPDNYYFQSGEIEVTRKSTILLGSFSGDNVYPVIIDSVNPDIDTETDFKNIIQ